MFVASPTLTVVTVLLLITKKKAKGSSANNL